MSDTPRTDNAQWGTGKVTTDFARQLERELNAANIRIEGLRAVVERFEELPANTEKADLVQNCKNLATQLNAANERIKRLEEAGDAMTFWCADEVSLEQWNNAKQ